MRYILFTSRAVATGASNKEVVRVMAEEMTERYAGGEANCSRHAARSTDLHDEGLPRPQVIDDIAA